MGTSHLQSPLVSPKLDQRDSQCTLTQNLLSTQTLKLKLTSDSLMFQLVLMRLTSLEPSPSSCQSIIRTTSHKTSLLSTETETSSSLLKLPPSSCQSITRTTNHKTSPSCRETETNLSWPKPPPSQLTPPLCNKPPQETLTLWTKRPLTPL